MRRFGVTDILRFCAAVTSLSLVKLGKVPVDLRLHCLKLPFDLSFFVLHACFLQLCVRPFAIKVDLLLELAVLWSARSYGSRWFTTPRLSKTSQGLPKFRFHGRFLNRCGRGSSWLRPFSNQSRFHLGHLGDCDLASLRIRLISRQFVLIICKLTPDLRWRGFQAWQVGLNRVLSSCLFNLLLGDARKVKLLLKRVTLVQSLPTALDSDPVPRNFSIYRLPVLGWSAPCCFGFCLHERFDFTLDPLNHLRVHHRYFKLHFSRSQLRQDCL